MQTYSVNVDGKDHSINVPDEWVDLGEEELLARIASEVRAKEAAHGTSGAAKIAQQIWNSSGMPGTAPCSFQRGHRGW